MAATTIERNATSINANAKRRTKATTGARFDQCVRLVPPLGRLPGDAGLGIRKRADGLGDDVGAHAEGRRPRRRRSFPAIGMVMFATVPAPFTSTVIGSNARPLASARRSSSAIACRIAGVRRTLGASTTTFAAGPSPGTPAASDRRS